MATGKRYYWIKIKDSFMTSDKVDFLMSQKDGANYVVLYQMLCMKCINTDGLLARQIGELIIPFDADKIARDCKFFSKDTVLIALELFKKLGMIYREDDGCLRIAEFENMVGSETDYAEQKRNQKSKEKIPCNNGNNLTYNVETGVENFHTDIRDKILDTRDKNLNNERELSLDNLIIKESGKTEFEKSETDEIQINSSLIQNNDNSNSVNLVEETQIKPKTEYAKELFNIWYENKLPGSKDFNTFLMKEFRLALPYIKNIKSGDVIQSCKNYVEVLNLQGFYNWRFTFDKFVQRSINNFLPDVFNIANWQKQENKPKVFVEEFKDLDERVELQRKKQQEFMQNAENIEIPEGL